MSRHVRKPRAMMPLPFQKKTRQKQTVKENKWITKHKQCKQIQKHQSNEYEADESSIYISAVYCRCEAAIFQAACPDIQRELSLDLGVFHSFTVMGSSQSPSTALAPSGSLAWFRRWGCTLGPKPRHILQQRTRLRRWPSGLWQKQQTAVPKWPRGGGRAVRHSPGRVEGEGGAGGNGPAGPQPGRIPVCCLHTQIPTKVLCWVCV